MLRECDLYEDLISFNGKYGGINRTGAIFIGRVLEPVPVPEMLTAKFSNDIIINNYKCLPMDLYAVQVRRDDKAETYACQGRIIVVVENEHPNNCITALKCKLFYNRLYDYDSFEANLVVGCTYKHRENNTYSLCSASVVTAEELKFDPEDRDKIIEDLIISPQMKSANPHIVPRHIIGVDCPILNNCGHKLPVFYKTENGALVFQSNLLSQFNELPAEALSETRNDWVLMNCLDTALKYSQYKSKHTCLEQRSLSPIVKKITTAVANAQGIIQDNLDGLNKITEDLAKPDCNTFCSRISDLLYQNWNNPLIDKRTGKSIMRQMLNLLIDNPIHLEEGTSKTILELLVDEIMETTTSETLIACFFGSTKGLGVVTKPDGTSCFDTCIEDELVSKLLRKLGIVGKQNISASFAFLWAVLGIRTKYVNLLTRLQSPYTALYLALHHPYFITFAAPEISITDLDLIACFTGNAWNKDAIIAPRSGAYMHSLLLRHDSKSIIFDINNLELDMGYRLSPRYKSNYTITGSMLNEAQIRLAQRVISADVRCGLPTAESSTYARGLDLVIPLGIDRETLLAHYISSGLGIQIGNQIMDYVYAYEFIYCMKRVYDANTGFTKVENLDDNARQEFEKNRNITLEPEQAKIINLVNFGASCLVGPAGSGKTTSLEYLITCLQRYSGITPDEILMLAPTGMAARRIYECTGHAASTIHSGLRIGSDAFDWGNERIKPSEDFEYKTVIFDESSMISLPLLYCALRRIPEDTQLIFTGDTEQLPPIDFGKPLADMLKFLPFIRLQVSKRASSASSITANCTNWISEMPLSLHNGTDTAFIPAKDDDKFPELIAKLCSYHLGNAKTSPVGITLKAQDGSPLIFGANDIQVVTPVSKAGYSWGSYELNKQLQNVFNPMKRGLFHLKYFDTANNPLELRVGDRVMNTANNHTAVRYCISDTDPDTLIRSGMGILNGDIGYVKAIKESISFNFLKRSSDGNDESSLVPDIESLKIAQGHSRYTRIYTLVEYTDIDGSKYCVIYTSYLEGTLSNGVTLHMPGDLRQLTLAYAITVHKMQGNQARLVIAPAFDIKRSGFITRNMIYTAWSRARDGLYVVGDVNQNFGSVLAKSRKYDSLAVRHSPMD